MNIKMLKGIITFSLVFAIIFSCLSLGITALAQGPDLGINYASNLNLAGTNQDPRDAAVNIVRYLMTFLGIIAVVVILFGGFKWMTAGGNEDRVAEAKKLIVAGIIGLIIVLAAFAIVQFVLSTTTNLLSNGTP